MKAFKEIQIKDLKPRDLVCVNPKGSVFRFILSIDKDLKHYSYAYCGTPIINVTGTVFNQMIGNREVEFDSIMWAVTDEKLKKRASSRIALMQSKVGRLKDK